MRDPWSYNAVKGIAAAILAASAVGCASNRIDLSREGIVKIAVADCHPVMISAKAEQDGNETVISGTIRRRSPMTPGRMHIDATITSPGGEVIASATALAHPRSIPYRGNRAHYFTVWFPFVPPRGSVIHLVCDAELHPAGEPPRAVNKGTVPG
ncbi:MAG: hypothetical protein QUV05_17445 [Phycisphaerae bacterium]|jgi:hypothetical protein|nr:hypothetical protein [Phycisphaerae bacterium]